MKGFFGKRERRPGGDGFVLLARFPEPWQADLAVSFLASEGIEAWSADELFINGVDHSAEMDGFGVIVNESDVMAAQGVLRMAERGELALPDETAEYKDEWNRRKTENVEPYFQEIESDTLNPQPAARNSVVVRCPRCGSENTERRKGIRSLFSPGYRCRICRWEWKGAGV